MGRRALLFSLATSDRLEAAVMALPPLRALAYRAARRYVAGPHVDDALAVARSLASESLEASIDLFGENAVSEADADAETEAFVDLARRLGTLPGNPYLSVDLSHLGLDLDRRACLRRLLRIAEALPDGARVQLGAEEARRADAIQAIARDAAGSGAPVDCTVQANLRRSPEDICRLAHAGVGVRLVKGAYVEPSGVALAWGPETDRAYVELAGRLAELGAACSLATHDPQVRARAVERGAARRVEMLLGVRAADARALREDGYEVRLYVPYGSRWLRFWSRRLAEAQGA